MANVGRLSQVFSHQGFEDFILALCSAITTWARRLPFSKDENPKVTLKILLALKGAWALPTFAHGKNCQPQDHRPFFYFVFSFFSSLFFGVKGSRVGSLNFARPTNAGTFAPQIWRLFISRRGRQAPARTGFLQPEVGFRHKR